MREVIPYIGITDFTDFEQVKEMLEVFRKFKPRGLKRLLHVGVMMSYKTLNGIETKWSKAFTPKEKIAGIFRPSEDEIHYYCLHYADYNQLTKPADLSYAIHYAGPYIDALQLDMTWPEPGMVADGVYRSRREIEVILQIGKKAMEEAGNDPAEVVERVEDYEDIIDRVLLDKSLGRGLPMDADGLIPFVEAIREGFPTLGIDVAGGLGPKTLHLVEPLIALFPDLSINAQGQLRPSGDSLDPIDWDMAKHYLIEAFKLFV